ncbi:MAG: hypothetical protein AAB610_02640 [Patescibacteria group bacterium]
MAHAEKSQEGVLSEAQIAECLKSGTPQGGGSPKLSRLLTTDQDSFSLHGGGFRPIGARHNRNKIHPHQFSST